MRIPIFFLLFLCSTARAENAIASTDFFPDPKPHLWQDGNVYVYPSHDMSADKYCSGNYHVISSPDLLTWKDNGISLQIEDTGLSKSVRLYACDVICKNGKYYLFSSNTAKKIVVLSSLSPTGPFTDPHIMNDISGIDPGVLIDDDGEAYIYWGQFNEVRAAKLKSNLFEIEQQTMVQPLSVKNFGFHEGSSVVKRGDTYYYIYASTIRNNRPTCLGYATGKSPLGPFTYQGVIIDNNGCDPCVWNNHGRIFEFKGNWYVFYHRSTHGTKFMRQTCIEPITFNADGTIPEVRMTSNGAGPRLCATNEVSVARACQLRGKLFLAQEKPGTELVLKNINDGDMAIFRGMDFNREFKTFEIRVKGGATNDQIEVMDEDAAGVSFGSISLKGQLYEENWRIESCSMSIPPNVKNIKLSFKMQTPMVTPRVPLTCDYFQWK